MSFHNRLDSRTKTKIEIASINTFATQVYAWMAVGLLVTAVVAWALFSTGAYLYFGSGAILLTILGTLGIAIAIRAGISRFSFTTLAGLFIAYAVLEGIFFGSILPVYAVAFGGGLIWTAFGTAGILFTIALCFGIFSKSDLTGIGRLLSIALIGLIVVTLAYFIVQFFVAIPWLYLLICYIGLIIFIGLTAYDAQQIRHMSKRVDGYSVASCKLSLVMALRMYINVIMIFWYLLQILSFSRR